MKLFPHYRYLVTWPSFSNRFIYPGLGQLFMRLKKRQSFRYILLSVNSTEIAKLEVRFYAHLKKNGYAQQQADVKLSNVICFLPLY